MSQLENPYSFEDIHQEALEQIKQLQNSRADTRFSDEDIAVLLGTQKAEDVLQYAKSTILAGSPDSRREQKMQKMSRLVEPLMAKLERYDNAINALLGLMPSPYGINFAGLIWGSLKFVLMIAKDVVQAWETVFSTLERIANILPSLRVYVELYSNSQLQMLKDPLVNVYADIVSFGLGAVKLLNKSRIRMFLSSLRTSLQGELDKMVSNMEGHLAEVDRIAGVEHMNETHEIKLSNDLLRQDLKAFISQQRNNALQAAPSNIVIKVKVADEVEQLIQKSSKSTAQEFTPKVGPFREAPVDRLSQWFSGREQELDKLHKCLQSHGADSSSSCVIYGMPGVGKSELALRFAQLVSNNNEYTYIMWISASTIEKLTQGVDSLIDLLSLPYLSDIDQKARLLAVRRWLETHDEKPSGRWLMIFDNVQKPVLEALRDLIPRAHNGGSIIFTTKNEQIASILASHGTHQHEILELEPPSPDEAVTLLCRAAGISASEVNAKLRAEAEALVNTMGRLPLAVENVASFMRQAKYSIDDFSNLYKSQHKMKIHEWRNDLSNYAEKSVAAAFESTFREISQAAPEGESLLCLFSFLDAEGVAIQMLIDGVSSSRLTTPHVPTTMRRTSTGIIQTIKDNLSWGSQLPKQAARPKNPYRSVSMNMAQDPELRRLLAMLQDPIERDTSIIKIQNLCLVKKQIFKTETLLTMHDLVQDLIRQRFIGNSRQDLWLSAAISIVCEAFRKLDDISLPGSWTKCEAFVPHIQALAKNATTLGFVSEELRSAQLAVAEYFESRGQYEEAGKLYQIAYDHYKTLKGDGGEMVLRAGNVRDELALRAAGGLASMLAQQGNMRDAEQLFELTYNAHKQAYGLEHKGTLRMRENLATMIRLQGRYDEAEKIFLQILSAHEQRQDGGPNHQDTLKTLRSLGLVYLSQNRVQDSERMFNRVYESYNVQYGTQNPDTLSAMHDLAYAYLALQDLEKAEPLFVTALQGHEELLGKQHYETLMVASNLALVYDLTSRSDKAEEMCLRAATGLAKQFGPVHHDVLAAKEKLAQIRVHQGQLAEGEALLQSVLAGQIESSGPDSKTSLTTAARLKRLQDSGILNTLDSVTVTVPFNPNST